MDSRKMSGSSSPILLLILLSSCCYHVSAAWGFGSSDPGKVSLRDVQVLTLKAGQMTTGRRSSPVPQLNCVGGSAQGQFKPQVVQCYNRGWDGQDVQWECKSDMDNLYRFGSVEVVCEGYDYPDDPYILKGSCGLEYTLELTKEGHNRQNNNHDYGYGSNSYSNNYGGSYSSYSKHNKTTGIGDLIVFAAVCLVIYALYKTCIDTPNNQNMGDRMYSSTGNDGGYPGGSPGGGGWFGGNNQNQGYQRYNDYGNDNCGGNARRGGTGGGGGFWSGMATGGLLGYMFGNRGGYGGYGYRQRPGWGWGGGYGGYARNSGFGGFSGGSSTSFGGGGGSSGTRTASGFGGTRRR